ncbi:oligosaccharide flippase family protein [Halorhabdus sp. CUG00001]|uniref:oligosaccharide flippase family protein n=1 Tax=Halorhabdus sp. CUG00001 TaxID=2600297 RepID=UPI00131CC34D|nr:oligosaccharide flippase family protein [Halorhabdus sp. CUG00001]
MDKNTAELDLGRETLIAVAAKLVLAVTGFAGVIIFTRVLGLGGVGKYYAILAAANLLNQVLSGFNGAIKKRVSEVDTPTGEYFGLGVAFNVAFVAVLTIVATLIYPFIKSIIGPFVFLVAFVAVVASLGAFSLINRLYSGIGNPGASFWTDTMRSLLTLGAQVALLWQGWNVLGLLIGFVFGTASTTLIVYLIVRVKPLFPSRTTLVRTYEFARWSVLNGLLENMYSRVDVLLLAAIVGNEAVGLYEPALRLTVPATFVSASIGDSLNVKSSGLDSIDKSVLSDLRNAISYTSLIAIPIFFGAAIMPEELMTIAFGPEFGAGATALVLLALFQLFNTYKQPFGMVLLGIDRPEINFRVKFLVLVIHLPLAVLLGLEFGLIGVIAATIVSEAFRVALYLVIAYWLFDEVLVTRPLGEQLLSGGIMFGVVYWLSTQVDIVGWPSLLVVVGSGAVVYFGMLFIVSPHFRGTADNVLSGVIPADRQYWKSRW